MWYKKIKQKKLQFTILGLLLFFSAVIFISCTSFVLELYTFNEDYFYKDTPDIYYSLNAKVTDEDLEEKFIKGEIGSYIKDIKKVDSIKIDSDIEVNGKEVYFALANINTIDTYTEYPYAFEVETNNNYKMAPADTKVWVNKIFADINDIKLGDKICIKESSRELEVSGLYNALINPSATMGYMPLIANKNITNYMDAEVDSSMVYIDVKDGLITNEELNTYLPFEYQQKMEISFDNALIKSTLDMTSTMSGGIGVLASLLMFIGAIVVIKFIIKSNIIKEYKAIGVYKALGFLNTEIIGFYLKAYLCIGAISIFLAMIVSIPITSFLGRLGTKYLIGFTTTNTVYSVGIISFLFLMCILAVNLYLALRKIKKIEPVEAFQIGIKSTKIKLNKAVIKNASGSFTT